MKKVAIFIDWENLRKDLEMLQRTYKTTNFNYNNHQHISTLVNYFMEADEEIYRIFFYTANSKSTTDVLAELQPTDKAQYTTYMAQTDRKGRTIESKVNNLHSVVKKFIDKIVEEPYFALRLGELKVRGLNSDGSPILAQKQVDMLFGLDISHVAYMKLADKILIFCKDSDMTPALKVARINGLTTIVANFENSFKITKKLIKHSDLIRTKDFQKLDTIV